MPHIELVIPSNPNLIEIHAAGFHPMKQFAKGPILKMVEHGCSILLWYPSDHRAYWMPDRKRIEIHTPQNVVDERAKGRSNPLDYAAIDLDTGGKCYYLNNILVKKLPRFDVELYGLKRYSPEEAAIMEAFGFQVRNGYVLERYAP